MSEENEPATPAAGGTARLVAPLYEARHWVRAAGVVAVLFGILLGLTQIGLVVFWAPIWLGVVLFQVASSLDDANLDDPEAVISLHWRLRFAFKLAVAIGIAALIFGFGMMLMVDPLGLGEVATDGGQGEMPMSPIQ